MIVRIETQAVVKRVYVVKVDKFPSEAEALALALDGDPISAIDVNEQLTRTWILMQ